MARSCRRGRTAVSATGAGRMCRRASLIDGQPASADVIADEPTVVLTIDREQMWWLVDVGRGRAESFESSRARRHDDAAIGESTRVQSQLERVATVDSLTGLRNRRWLDDTFPARSNGRRARIGRPPPCSSTWTGSSRSTTSTVTRLAMPFCAAWLRSWRPRSGRRIFWRATEAKSLPCCSRTQTWPRRNPSLNVFEGRSRQRPSSSRMCQRSR